MSLSPEEITALLTTKRTADKARSIPQGGPLRWYDYEMRCASLGCGSPTYTKIEGAPRCMMHALKEINQIVINLTERLTPVV